MWTKAFYFVFAGICTAVPMSHVSAQSAFPDAVVLASPTSEEFTLINERFSDILSVQEALEGSPGAGAKTAICAEFRSREVARSASLSAAFVRWEAERIDLRTRVPQANESSISSTPLIQAQKAALNAIEQARAQASGVPSAKRSAVASQAALGNWETFTALQLAVRTATANARAARPESSSPSVTPLSPLMQSQRDHLALIEAARQQLSQTPLEQRATLQQQWLAQLISSKARFQTPPLPPTDHLLIP